MKSAVALRHVHFEDVGTFGGPLAAAGYEVTYSDVGSPDFCSFPAEDPDLLIVLGGPIGVYETKTDPFLEVELTLIAKRLAAGRPILGICLGAQLIAAASGARVYPSGIKEIGFAPVDLTPDGATSPLRHLDGAHVLHWHGDTYDLPAGAAHLATTDLVAQQAFTIGNSVLGLQFHPEACTGPEFERWLVGHTAELAAAMVNVPKLRADAGLFGGRLKHASTDLMREWLSDLPGN